MNPKGFWRRLLPILFIVCVAGCDTPQKPPCKLSDLVIPDPTSPSSLEVVDGDAIMFSWDFPSTCDPAAFILEVDNNQSFAEPHLISYRIPGEMNDWLAPDKFTEGKEFYWRIRAVGSGTDLSDWTDPIKFYTGPLCPSSWLEEIDSIHPRYRIAIHEEPIRFSWNRPDVPCLPPGYYIEIYPDVEIDDETEQLVAEYWIHDPENEFEASPGLDCGEYKWKITPLGYEDMSSINCYFCTPVEFARFEFDDGSCDPPDTDPVTTAETIYDSPCRGGPGKEYPIQSYILEGEIATLLGRDIENIWWVIEDPLNSERRCWIIQNVVITEGLTSELPILSAPALPGGSGNDGNGSGGSPVCGPNLSAEECKAAGGTYNINALPPCKCP